METQQTPNSSRSQVMQAAGVVAGAFILSRLMGWVRDAIFGYYFGVDTPEAVATNRARANNMRVP